MKFFKKSFHHLLPHQFLARVRELFPLAVVATIAIVGFGCGSPTADGSSATGKQAILDAVDLALTAEHCTDAVTSITGLYNSGNTDNVVRLRAASAYGCNAKVNLFQLIDDISNNSSKLSGSGFWEVMTQVFPSTAGQDYVVEGSVLAIDALQAALSPGALVLPTNQVNPGTFNVGSVFPSDRISDANLYMIFIAMAGIGGIQNRFGAPDSNFQKTQDLSWKTATQVDANGCMYASTILNFIDAVTISQNYVGGSLSTNLGTLKGAFSSAFDAACELGCNGQVPPAASAFNTNGNWTATGCSFAVGSCSTCPVALRDRSKCTQLATDKVSCAAAGIVNFMNAAVAGWQGP